MYEIPQELQYSEKVFFGLTMKQAFIALSTLVLVYFTFFKWSVNIWIKYPVVGIEIVLGIAFIFFNFDILIKNITLWLFSRKRELTEKNNRVLLGIKKFESDHLMIGNTKTAILEVLPMNFLIRNNDEKDGVVKTFRKLLQAIDYPTQYFMKTEPLDIIPYLNNLDRTVKSSVSKSKEQDFTGQLENLKEHLLEIISENNISNRRFYIIIPESTGLDIQVKIVEEKIKNLGLKSKRLKNKDLQDLITNFLPEGKELINEKTLLKMGEQYSRIIVANGYPRLVEPGFLDKIVSMQGNFDLSIHITPKPISTTMVMLNKELQKQRSDLYSEEQKNIVNPSLEIKYADTRRVLEELQKGQDKIFDVSLYINCRAKSLEELNLLTKKVEAELNSVLIIPEVPRFKQLQGLKSVAPISQNILQVNRNITTTALSAFFPFTSKFSDIDKNGVWLGLNKNNIPIIKDTFSFSNPNGIILASSGAGKSYAAKLFIARQLLLGTRVIIIDPQGEYRDLVKQYKGQIINLDTKSETIINPLDLVEHSYEEKRLTLMDLMKVMLGTLTEPQKSFIDKAISQAYQEKKINEDPKTWKNTPPTLEDVLRELKKMEKTINSLADPSIQSLINRLELYVSGVFKFLNKHTKIDFNKQLVCFNIHELPSQVQPVMMFLILDFVYMKMQKDINRKILLIDEAWKLLSRAEDANYVFTIVKTCRKFNMGLLLINQEVEGLFESSAGKSVLANSSYTLLLKQKPSVIKQLASTFNLSDYEKDYLLTAGIGEGILITEQDHNEIKIVASESENELITTNPDEKLKQKDRGEKVENNKEDKKEDFKITKNAYNKESLDEEKINLLRKNGFTEFSGKFLNAKKTFFLKTRNNELKIHLFGVCAITDYLRSKNLNVRVFKTGSPDIEITLKDEKFAIEVESGKNYLFHNKSLEKKLQKLNKDYHGKAIIVVTNPLMKQYYETILPAYTLNQVEHGIKELIKH